MPTLTQAQARQHAMQAQRGNMRSLEILLNELIGGDIALDNLTITTAIIPAGGALHSRGRTMQTQAAPETATATATLTAAQMLSGILVATPAAVATYTTLTGTLLLAALPTTIAAGDTFDLHIINLGGAGDIITMAGGTDVTFVGSLTIDDAGADINSSGTYRFRYTTGVTFVAYRIA